MHCVSQSLEELIDVIRAAGLVNGKILFIRRLAPLLPNSRCYQGAWLRNTYRVAIFPVLAWGNIVGARQPGNLLATVTDSKDWHPQVEVCRIDIFRSISSWVL